MMTTGLLRIAATLAAVMTLGMSLGAQAQPATRPAGGATDVIRPPRREEKPANPPPPTLWIIGDSTVRNGQGDGGNGQWGWGSRLGQYFDTTKINVVNRALGGTSSRTFMTMGRYDAVLAEAKAGDYLLMQFGHNDDIALNDAVRARGTIKGIGEETEEIDNMVTKKHEVVHTFGWYIAKYVKDAKAKGMTPIICSWIPRLPSKPVTPTTQPGSYQLWAQQVAEREGAAYIDLRSLIYAEYAKMTPEDIKEKYFAHDPKTGKVDSTHTSDAGAVLNAQKVVEGVKGLDLPLKTFLK
jgi:lysophospholipase L1-like esterase